jgi:outer membrane receptor protein involved in Fe transport
MSCSDAGMRFFHLSINTMHPVPKLIGIYLSALLGVDARAQDQNAATLPPELVVQVNAASQPGAEMPVRLLPYTVQGLDAVDIGRTQSTDVTDVLNRRLAGVALSNAQGNPLQPEVQYRGFSATPLLGGSEGISVYVDGVRINELFGDTVNWDLVPKDGIADLRLLSGANPVFGLNTLGGALDIHTKTGFDAPGTHAEVATGSFGRTTSSIETGGHTDRWGYYVMGSHFQERGWRDRSPSDATNFLAASSWHWHAGSADLKLAHAESTMTGNGAAPVDELALRRSAIFTAPDRTSNRLNSLTFNASQDLGPQLQLSGTVYLRQVRTLSYNGDQSDFEACDDHGAILCEDDGPAVRDQHGNQVDAQYDAIANIGVRRQRTHGATLQLSSKRSLFGLSNHFVAGLDAARGTVAYSSSLELARLSYPADLPYGALVADGTGLSVPDHALHVAVNDQRDGAYVLDTVEVTPRLAVTAAARYNRSHTSLRDQSGAHPELDGDHRYHRLNPSLGAAFQWTPAVNLFGGYSEATRVPTPVELSCADSTAPCLLPNDFVADPDLKQVVAKSWEAGLRGAVGTLHWQGALFRTKNIDDILFQATGGAQSNRGFYANVGDTRRQGVQLSLDGKAAGRIDWFLRYTWLDATFLSAFDEASANHPAADPETGLLHVPRGSYIPGLARSALKAGADHAFDNGLAVGADMTYNSGHYLRGDEANLLGKTAGYAILNLHGRYRIGKGVTLLVHVDNLFDHRYASFGTLGDPSAVLAGSSNPRFVTPGAPREAAVSISLDL